MFERCIVYVVENFVLGRGLIFFLFVIFFLFFVLFFFELVVLLLNLRLSGLFLVILFIDFGLKFLSLKWLFGFWG